MTKTILISVAIVTTIVIAILLTLVITRLLGLWPDWMIHLELVIKSHLTHLPIH